MRLLVLAMATVLVAGCTTANQALSNASDIAINIDEDAVQMNESHTRSINSVIALNVLRAMDRMPTGYTTLSGITNQPTRQFDLGTELSPIGLGNPVNPLGKSTVTASGKRGASAQYSVNPFAGGKGSQSLYTASESDVFLKRYWSANWPKDLLIALFVRSGELNGPCVLNGKGMPSGDREDSSGQSSNQSEPKDEPSGCEVLNEVFKKPSDLVLGVRGDFNCTNKTCSKLKKAAEPEKCEPMDRELAALLFSSGEQTLSTRIASIEKVSGNRTLKINSDSVSLCKKPKLADGRSPSELMLLMKRTNGEASQKGSENEASKKVGEHQASKREAEDEFTIVLAGLKLRSFDEMVYFLGENLRLEDDKRWLVSCDDGDVPLFDLGRREDAVEGMDYDIEISYAGEQWVGLPYSIGCSESRTGSVLTILSQIFVLRQSKEFLEAPDILLAR